MQKEDMENNHILLPLYYWGGISYQVFEQHHLNTAGSSEHTDVELRGDRTCCTTPVTPLGYPSGRSPKADPGWIPLFSDYCCWLLSEMGTPALTRTTAYHAVWRRLDLNCCWALQGKPLPTVVDGERWHPSGYALPAALRAAAEDNRGTAVSPLTFHPNIRCYGPWRRRSSTMQIQKSNYDLTEKHHLAQRSSTAMCFEGAISEMSTWKIKSATTPLITVLSAAKTLQWGKMYVYHEMGNAERFGREMCSFIDKLQKEIMVLKDVLPLLTVTTHRVPETEELHVETLVQIGRRALPKPWDVSVEMGLVVTQFQQPCGSACVSGCWFLNEGIGKLSATPDVLGVRMEPAKGLSKEELIPQVSLPSHLSHEMRDQRKGTLLKRHTAALVELTTRAGAYAVRANA
ncbi:hypothetical protein Anapl_14889 [Anas platyrhynchos]|uniref:Uncharacterized protein n=1 Tax=Anas platyrhynchos TaxID=8839 RepID=R0JBG1_ANAPL|nr:hypothetical protein Anapl_14889 [Anas platyrhynchos]